MGSCSAQGNFLRARTPSIIGASLSRPHTDSEIESRVCIIAEREVRQVIVKCGSGRVFTVGVITRWPLDEIKFVSAHRPISRHLQDPCTLGQS